MRNSLLLTAALVLATATITVSAQSVPVESITITPTSAKLAVSGSRTYKAEILPAEAAAGAQVVWESSEPRVATIDANGKVRGMAPGITVVKATCGGKSAELTLTVSIKAPKVGYYLFSDGTWEQGAIVPGKTCVGLVFYVNADGKSGKAVSLDEAERLNWSLAAMPAPAANDALNGAANCAEIEKVADWTTGFQAANWCVSKSTDKLEWYLPAVDELRQLFAASCGLTWVASGADETKGQVNNWTENNKTMVSNGDDPVLDPYPEARAAFNSSLTKAGGTALAADKYWSSTMMNEQAALFLSFEGGFSNGQPKQFDFVCRTRAITSFPDPEPIMPVITSVPEVTLPGNALDVKTDGATVTLNSALDIKAVNVYALTGVAVGVNAGINGTQASFGTASMQRGIYIIVATLADGSNVSTRIRL